MARRGLAPCDLSKITKNPPHMALPDLSALDFPGLARCIGANRF
jgi:hypothetical protein